VCVQLAGFSLFYKYTFSPEMLDPMPPPTVPPQESEEPATCSYQPLANVLPLQLACTVLREIVQDCSETAREHLLDVVLALIKLLAGKRFLAGSFADLCDLVLSLAQAQEALLPKVTNRGDRVAPSVCFPSHSSPSWHLFAPRSQQP
jgi:hypothetical protein